MNPRDIAGERKHKKNKQKQPLQYSSTVHIHKIHKQQQRCESLWDKHHRKTLRCWRFYYVTGTATLANTGAGMMLVSYWCLTPNQPVRLSQGGAGMTCNREDNSGELAWSEQSHDRNHNPLPFTAGVSSRGVTGTCPATRTSRPWGAGRTGGRKVGRSRPAVSWSPATYCRTWSTPRFPSWPPQSPGSGPTGCCSVQL